MEQYEVLQQIAEENRVSFAWVVRAVVEKHLADKTPLFDRGK